MQSVDIVTIGDDMVGLAVAYDLQDNGLRVTVLEQHVPQPLMTDALPQPHISAINAASERLLTRLGVWSGIVVRHACCYRGMEVWDEDSFGHIEFSDQSMGYNHLGRIVEDSEIHYALWQKAQRSADITLMMPAEIQQIAWGESGAFLSLKDDAMLAACLVVDADSTNSWLRDKANIPLALWDYRHHALVTTIRTQEAHDAIVRQTFHSEGVLTFLPLNDPYLCSIVWSLSPQKTEHIQQASVNELNQTLNIAFGSHLELYNLESEYQAFPLTGCYARQFTARRLALARDATHTIHPLVDQGVNLGFMDTAELIDEFKRLRCQGKDIGQYLYLRRYKHSRRHNAALMLARMQGFRELFADKNPAKKLLRDIGLKLVDILPSVELQFIRQVVGLSGLPERLRQCP